MLGNSIAADLKNKIQFYRDRQFTGLVRISSRNHTQQQWTLCYLLGRIVWINSRIHTLRRWKRSIAIHSPTVSERITQAEGLSHEAWHYTALARLVKLKKFPRSQFSNIVESSAAEDLFDIFQVGTQIGNSQIGSPQVDAQGQPPRQDALTYTEMTYEVANLPFIMIQHEHAWREAQQEWRDWQQADLAGLSPDVAPVIVQTETLRKRTAPQTFQTLTALVNGENTLRDLALKFRQPIIPLTKSILPYVTEGMLAFTEIPDLAEQVTHGFSPELFTRGSAAVEPELPGPLESPEPVAKSAGYKSAGYSGSISIPPVRNLSGENRPLQPSSSVRSSFPPGTAPATNAPAPRSATGPQIVYIDDSPADSRSMSEIVAGLGCGYTNIPNPIQALPMLLEIKPALIFLDLVMPVANGYEVCAQIRRISAFKQTPIIIVTSNDGIADRVRARLVGASGFLGKPIRAQKVAKVLSKHLQLPKPSGRAAQPGLPTQTQAKPKTGGVLSP
ncbi:MAG: response regulator [Cyanobacteria bacterium J06649_5]